MADRIKKKCRHCGKDIYSTGDGRWVADTPRPYYCGLRFDPRVKHEPRKEAER